ncbi:MAG: 5-formyltetrahydrofolate cyclo-ligase [Coriobacteriales bacterium]|jgi:5-formyltetrahydrofolate cyclo-ligase|nr:5-formyltetrahydrofolate cyclo-ligase [Coriobacteriales bacterium]
MVDFKKEKSEFRKMMLAKRAAMTSDERATANSKIFQSVISLPEYKRAQTIFTYVSVTDEPETITLIEDAWKHDKRVCVPRCVSFGVMHAHAIRSMDDLQKGMYDIPEPKDVCPLVSPGEMELIIVPCVCCGKDGYRLGYGGGFYDRWLEKRNAPAAVLCFEEMLVAAVPCEAHDKRTNILVSDASFSILRFP